MGQERELRGRKRCRPSGAGSRWGGCSRHSRAGLHAAAPFGGWKRYDQATILPLFLLLLFEVLEERLEIVIEPLHQLLPDTVHFFDDGIIHRIDLPDHHTSPIDAPALVIGPYGKISPMEMLERLKQQASAWPELKLAVLFGSTARGKARPKSDVDLGILLDPYSPELRFRLEGDLGRVAGRPVDVILLDGAPPLLRFEIAREGVLLFQREDHLWTDFKTKAMVDWWDWAPTHRMIAAGVVRRLRERVAHGQG